MIRETVKQILLRIRYYNPLPLFFFFVVVSVSPFFLFLGVWFFIWAVGSYDFVKGFFFFNGLDFYQLCIISSAHGRKYSSAGNNICYFFHSHSFYLFICKNWIIYSTQTNVFYYASKLTWDFSVQISTLSIFI